MGSERVSIAVLALAALLACERASPPDQTPPASSAGAARPERIGRMNLAARVAAWQREQPKATDISETFLAVPGATVHMHILGFGQTVPLHVHREAEEVTLLVNGEASILQIWGRNGERVEESGVYGPGTLIQSPPMCAHEWFNPSQDKMLGNLVFALPSFLGNLYLKPEDPRPLEGGEPFRYSVEDDLRAFAAGEETQRVVVLPIMRGAMSVLLLKESYVVEPNPAGPFIGYVLSGRARLQGSGELRPQHLLRFNPGRPVTLHARKQNPLALLLFDPHQAIADREAALGERSPTSEGG
jgi:uncharacterized RmlC-like cupin family protein